MTPLQYRDEIVRAVLGERPAIGAQVADSKRLNEFCATLAQTEAAKDVLCANGLGEPSMAIDALVRLAVEK